MKIKKFLSVLTALSVVMTVFTGIGTVSYAENDSGIISDQVAWGASKDSLTQKGTFNEAITAAEQNEEIKYLQLLVDIDTVPTGYTITGGEFTLDLNGHSVESPGYTISVYDGAKVTIDDSSEGKKGTVTTIADDEDSGCSAIFAISSEVTIKNGKYTGGGVNNGKATYAVKVDNGSKLTIDGGTFNGGTGISMENDSEVTINGGTVAPTFYDAIEVYNGSTLTINDCKIITTKYYGSVTFDGKKLDLSNYKEMPEGFDVYCLGVDEDAETHTLILPEGFKVYDQWNCVSECYDKDGQRYTGKTSELLLFYKTTVPEIVKEVEWTTSDNKTEQGPLKKAVDLANKGTAVTYIKLIDDLNENYTYIYKGEYTVDLNGHTITYDYSCFAVYDSVVTFTDTSADKTGKMVPKNGDDDYCPVFAGQNGKVIINGGTYIGPYALDISKVGETALAEVNGGTLEGTCYSAIYCNGDLKLNGGTIKAGANGHIEYSSGCADVSGYADFENLIIGSDVYESTPINDTTIKLPKGYALYDNNGNEISELTTCGQMVGEKYVVDMYTVSKKKYNAEKVTVSGAETNADAVGYYVKNVPWHDGLKWYAVTDDSKTLTTAVDFGTKISGDLDVSFGIVLHGKLGDYTTSNIESVYVSK